MPGDDEDAGEADGECTGVVVSSVSITLERSASTEATCFPVLLLVGREGARWTGFSGLKGCGFVLGLGGAGALLVDVALE